MPLRLWLSNRGIVGSLLPILLVFPRGQWWCPLLPPDRRLHTVVGVPVWPSRAAAHDASSPAPAEVTHEVTHEVTAEQVNAFHAKYVAALVALYDRHKVDYYGKEAVLEIW